MSSDFAAKDEDSVGPETHLNFFLVSNINFDGNT